MSMTIDISDDLPLNLDVSIYGENEKISDTLSKCRVRIFYKGLNRNRTYISEEFAQELINSLPYAPIKGIFNYTDVDYEDHGEDNTDGRIYGIIPENPNFAWEKHLDKDGIEREYATADVYLFTGLYPESSLIKDKPQSMELFKQTLEGEWRISEEDGKPVFYFLHGSLVGLQVLGKDVEPCFEGAAFFNLFKDIQNCVEYIKKLQFSKMEGDKMQVDKSLFRLSDNEKAEAIFDAINPNYNEEGDWQLDYYLLDVYDDYALCGDKKKKKYVRFSYVKNADDTITVGEPTEVFIVDVTSAEYAALETMKAMNTTYEATVEKYNELSASVETLEAEKAEFTSTKENLETENANFKSQIETLETEKAEFESSITAKDTEISEFKNQIESLQNANAALETEKNALSDSNNELLEFKKNTENTEKSKIIEEFSSHLTDEEIENLNNSMENFSVIDFKKEVCLAAYNGSTDLFSKHDDGLVFKGNTDNSESGVTRILKRYKNGGNK